MTKPRKRRIIRHIIKQGKLAPKRTAQVFEKLSKTKVRWL